MDGNEGRRKYPIEKIKLLGALLIAFGGKQDDVKVVLKVLDETNKHFTMKIGGDMMFDIHETKEGTVKEYTPIAREKIDLDTSKFEELALEIVRSAELIDPDDKSLEQERILVMKRLDFLPLAQNRKVEIQNMEQMSDVMTAVEGVKPLRDIEFRTAMTFENDVPKDMIIKIEGKLYRLNFKTIVEKLAKHFDSDFVRQGMTKMEQRRKESAARVPPD